VLIHAGKHGYMIFCKVCYRDLINVRPGPSGLECALLAEILILNEKWLRSSKNTFVAISVIVEEALQS